MQIRQMVSRTSDRPVANQFIIEDDKATYFQSYKSIIVKRSHADQITLLDEHYWDYSTTTGKYRNQFLNEKRPETERKIKSGEYILTNLN